MKKGFVGLVSGLLFLALAAPYSFAQMCGPGAGPGRGYYDERMPMMHRGDGMMRRANHHWQMLKTLGLDPKQTETVKGIRSRVEKDTVRKRADIQVARIELRDMLGKDQVDMSSVEATLKKIAGLQTEIRLSHIKAMQDIKAVLTPEQRKKFQELREMGPIGRKAAMAAGMQQACCGENQEMQASAE